MYHLDGVMTWSWWYQSREHATATDEQADEWGKIRGDHRFTSSKHRKATSPRSSRRASAASTHRCCARVRRYVLVRGSARALCRDGHALQRCALQRWVIRNALKRFEFQTQHCALQRKVKTLYAAAQGKNVMRCSAR
jgi:hypothetical protein